MFTYKDVQDLLVDSYREMILKGILTDKAPFSKRDITEYHSDWIRIKHPDLDGDILIVVRFSKTEAPDNIKPFGL